MAVGRVDGRPGAGAEAFARRLRRNVRVNPREQGQFKGLCRPVSWTRIVFAVEAMKIVGAFSPALQAGLSARADNWRPSHQQSMLASGLWASDCPHRSRVDLLPGDSQRAESPYRDSLG